jgi:hypothetical protein
MRRRMIMTIIMLGLWPLLVMVMSDHAADAAWSSPRVRCDAAPLSGLARPDVPFLLTQYSPSCSCPPLECPNGTVEPCAADCFMSQVPDCRCEAWCDADGDPRGSNVCECH